MKLEQIIELLSNIGNGYVVANGVIRTCGNTIVIDNDVIKLTTESGREIIFDDLNMLSYYLSI